MLLNIASRRSYCYRPVKRRTVFKDLNKNSIKKREETINLAKHIRNRIIATGPITVAQYMTEVLTHPSVGYYMNRDVFGLCGDFITSPEISQIFGELVAVWIVNEWVKLGSPQPFQLIELGPGRGTLIKDILRVLTQLKLSKQLSLHLVEISEFLSQLQAQTICFEFEKLNDCTLPYYQIGKTEGGCAVYWYKRLEDIPQDFAIVLAHEFFDAMPVHKLKLMSGIWKEVLINISEEKPENFKFVLSNSPTPISQLFKPLPEETRTSIEYSIESDRIVRIIAERLQCYGGIALIIDYGHFGEKVDTLRAFKRHKLHNFLQDPGTADLTADVDFRQLKSVVEENSMVFCYGPIEQAQFLMKMNGNLRLQQLLKNAPPGSRELINSGYAMLTKSDQMGQRYKFLAMFPSVLKNHLNKFPPSGFD